MNLWLLVAQGWRRGMGEGTVMEFEMDTYTPLYLKCMTNKDILYRTWNSAQCYVAAWMGEESRGNGYRYRYG